MGSLLACQENNIYFSV